jgi:hypothetical protein
MLETSLRKAAARQAPDGLNANPIQARAAATVKSSFRYCVRHFLPTANEEKKDLLQRVNFHHGDAGRVVHAAHDRGVVRGR